MKTKTTRNKFPWNESTPETEDCECKTYSVEVEGGKFGCGVPRSVAHRLTNIAELCSDHFSRLVGKFIKFLMQKHNFHLLYSVMNDLWLQ